MSVCLSINPQVRSSLCPSICIMHEVSLAYLFLILINLEIMLVTFCLKGFLLFNVKDFIVGYPAQPQSLLKLPMQNYMNVKPVEAIKALSM